MNDEQLIKLVKPHICLYSKYSHRYQYYEKEDAWESIAEKLGATKEDCIHRWTHLRCRYSKESRRRQMLEQNGLKASYLWPLFHDLQFLEAHIIPRRKRVSYMVRDERSATHTSFNVKKKMEIENSPTSSLSEREVDDFMITDSSISSFVSQPKPKIIKNANEIYVSPKLNVNHSKNLSSHRNNEGSESNESEFGRNSKNISIEIERGDTTQSRHTNLAVRGFGQMIVETICSMSQRKQAIAMQKITEITMKLRMEPDY